jgi:hypothetical protein
MHARRSERAVPSADHMSSGTTSGIRVLSSGCVWLFRVSAAHEAPEESRSRLCGLPLKLPLAVGDPQTGHAAMLRCCQCQQAPMSGQARGWARALPLRVAARAQPGRPARRGSDHASDYARCDSGAAAGRRARRRRAALRHGPGSAQHHPAAASAPPGPSLIQS